MTENIFTATSDATMRENIRASWQRADEHCRDQGRTWYPSTHELVADLAMDAGLPVDVVAGIMAVLSPRSAWGTNVRNTAAVLVEAGHLDVDRASAILTHHGYDGDTMRLLDGPRGLGTSIAKARTIAETENAGPYVTGQKVLSFFHNIADPKHSDDVTIDAWAAGVAIGRRLTNADMSKLNARQYQRVAEQYRIVAGELGMIASELQAATWCEIRGRAR